MYSTINGTDHSLATELASSIRGKVITPTDIDYDKERRVFNGAIDRRPALIVKCAGTRDVVNTIRFARSNKILVSVRGSGHSVGGHSVCDGGIVIDLSKMKGIHVNPVDFAARAQPGTTWGEFDYETQLFGLATTGGTVSTTGISGLTLGGGIGWLMSKYGLTCDNLLAADLITADGEFLIADKDHNSDLFWGLRGGGWNFGVVTSFKYKLHKVGPVLAGSIIFPMESGRPVLEFFREFTEDLPDELTTSLTFMTNSRGMRIISFDFCYSGDDLERGKYFLRSINNLDNVLKDTVSSISYCEFQKLYDNPLRAGLRSYWRSNYMKGVTDGFIDTILDHFNKVPSDNTLIMLEHYHGKMSRVPPSATAFGHRDANYGLLIISNWIDTHEEDRNLDWSNKFFLAIQPHTMKKVYVNYLDNEPSERVEIAYGPESYDRLVTLKNKYDPTNFFRMNQNVGPRK